ncbi:hypothetical protein [Flammeovirga sp. SJP92]|uniref:hypothetical protein n=1 Tax=Flammeovirga sp. SJP92 TaxID=1775430 RepID=UPI0007880724|nr:hypothetical protein [Flammeovirga sp. SJP92]KXX66739.1 hypothetical protein AVL50_30780 [Flammeovirga sp. SJP92]
MEIPEKSILHLYNGTPSKEHLERIGCDENDINGYKIEEIFWLNTPGPIYTTQTDNCGTGQPEAPNNVGGDESYYEFIFKQPLNTIELNEIKNVANVDPFGGYYFDGNDYWTNERIINWWSRIDTVIEYMTHRYEEELQLPLNAHNTLYDFGKGLEEAHFFGPTNPVPENYKSALDFYRHGLKEFLEWYMEYNNGSTVELDTLVHDWTYKEKLDKKLREFIPVKRDLLKEYNENQKESKQIKIKNRPNFWEKLKSVFK